MNNTRNEQYNRYAEYWTLLRARIAEVVSVLHAFPSCSLIKLWNKFALYHHQVHEGLGVLPVP
jgi:hypothetical protein